MTTLDKETRAEVVARAVALAKDLIAAAQRQLHQSTGGGVITAAFDVAEPALNKIVPGAAVLLPIIRKVIIPMVEDKLTPAEYDAMIQSTMDLEVGLQELVALATDERQRIMKMSDAEIDVYARKVGLYRNEGTP